MWIKFIVICVVLFIVKYHWSRRKFYALAWKVHGPIAFPFIGNGNLFLNDLGLYFELNIFNKMKSFIESNYFNIFKTIILKKKLSFFIFSNYMYTRRQRQDQKNC